MAGDFDLIKMKYEFLDLDINGTNQGLYVAQESFGKEMVERNKRRNGPIFRFNDTLSSVLEVWPEKEYLLDDMGWGFSRLWFYKGPGRFFSLSNVKFLNSLN